MKGRLPFPRCSDPYCLHKSGVEVAPIGPIRDCSWCCPSTARNHYFATNLPAHTHQSPVPPTANDWDMEIYILVRIICIARWQNRFVCGRGISEPLRTTRGCHPRPVRRCRKHSLFCQSAGPVVVWGETAGWLNLGIRRCVQSTIAVGHIRADAVAMGLWRRMRCHQYRWWTTPGNNMAEAEDVNTGGYEERGKGAQDADICKWGWDR